MRRPKACATCRARRRKCVTQPGQDTCDHCALHGTECVQELPRGGWYEQRALQKKGAQQQPRKQQQKQSIDIDASPSSHNAHAISPGSGVTDEHDHHVHSQHQQQQPQQKVLPPHQTGPVQLPDMDLLLEIVNLYFDYVHDQFHSLFHRPTFIQDVTQHLIPHPLLFGILGLGARFSTNPALADLEPRDKGRKYMREAERHLNLRDISLETVQLCVLLGAGSTGDGETEGENLFYSVSCRTAQLLGLPHRVAVSPLQKEIDNRVWWSLCMIDVWSSAAVKLPRLLPFDGDGAPLPMDDLPFLHLQRPTPKSASSPSSLPPSGAPSPEQPIFERRSPIIAQMVQLNRILLEVNDFNKQCATHNLSPVEVENGIQTLIHRMDGWLSEAPRDVRDTPDNFHWFHVRGLGRAYAAIYLGYYHFGQLLYYQFLHVGNGVPAGSPARIYSDRCKYHSAQLCDMIYRAFFTPGSDVRYHMVAHVLVIASTVQIHTLLFSEDEPQIADAKARLEKNFEILLLLRPYWPALDRIMGRLRAFHETCRVNMSSSFVLDRWMLQFLVAFGGIMDEKPAMVGDDPTDFYCLDGIL